MAGSTVLAVIVLASIGGRDAVDWIDPFVGTVEQGNTFPGSCRPFGMVQASPDSGSHVTPSGYKHDDGTIRGFSQTHLNGTGCPALGDISLMPFAGEETGPGHLRAYIRETEKASPDLYEVTLDNGIRVRGTAAQRVGLWQFTYDTDLAKRLYFDAASSLVLNPAKKYGPYVPESSIALSEDRREIRGYRKTNGWAVRKVFYCARFSRPWTTAVKEPRDAFEGAGERYTLDFADLEKGETLEVRVAISTVSEKNAVANLEHEAGRGVSFEAVRSATRKEWNTLLGRVEMEGTDAQRRSVYTALYHLFVQPNDIADVDGRYRGADDVVKTSSCGHYYSTMSLWDTFRAAHPLYTILAPERVEGFIETMIAHGRAHGHLPIWTLWGQETHDMIAVHSIPVMVDAFSKGFGGVDWNEALDLMVRSLTKTRKDCYQGEWNVYWENDGYYPYRPGRWDEGWTPGASCSRTLEVCYDWWCVERLAAALGNERTRKAAAERAAAWRKIFDRDSGFIRPRGPSYEGAEWRTPFDPRLTRQGPADLYGDYTEGNAWQYTWHVFQEPFALAELMGGADKAIAKLDEMFATLPVRPDVVSANNDEGGLAGKPGQIGQYWHGNEPSHHVAYLYSVLGRNDRAAELIRRICRECYRDSPDGLCGNEDCGQMSAWYLFSCMGFYPFNPCGGTYVIGAPQLPKMIIHLAGGNTLIIKAESISEANRFVEAVKMNGKTLTGCMLRHSDLAAGGELVFEMKR